ncbi:hypothetical protein [Acuticoccus sp.]|uniref:hypothetical protein n=1 Tax=Acuticoccus sp. TaxID=1904378 RepID=UPI003B52B4B7
MAQFYSPTTQTLFDDILWLPQAGAKAGPTGRPPNSYAILLQGSSILIDAVYSWTLDGIRKIADAGMPPSAFVLTHVDVAEQGDAFEEIRSQYGCPILLHPADHGPRAAKAGVAFMDPREDRAIVDARFDVIEMPFHTPGSIMLHTNRNRGVVFAGDSAVAPGPKQDPEPPRLARPKVDEALEEDFKEQWMVLKSQRLMSSILPLHGTPYVDRPDLRDIAMSLREGPPMDPSEEASGDYGSQASGVAA